MCFQCYNNQVIPANAAYDAPYTSYRNSTEGGGLGGSTPTSEDTSSCCCPACTGEMGTGIGHACPNPNNRPLKRWSVINVPSIVSALRGSERLPPGLPAFSLYDRKLANHYEVPSENVFATHGSVRYMEHYNEHGPYTRFRFQVCAKHLTKRCNRGFDCTYIHVDVLPSTNVSVRQGTSVTPACTAVHVNSQNSAYDCMEPGSMIYVHNPNSNVFHAIPSECMLRTAGAELIVSCIADKTSTAKIKRPQHCAHFLFKKLCNRGPECNFLHVPSHVLYSLNSE